MQAMRESRGRPYWRSRWWMPGFSLFLGALMFGALTIGGSPGEGVFAFVRLAAPWNDDTYAPRRLLHSGSSAGKIESANAQ